MRIVCLQVRGRKIPFAWTGQKKLCFPVYGANVKCSDALFPGSFMENRQSALLRLFFRGKDEDYAAGKSGKTPSPTGITSSASCPSPPYRPAFSCEPPVLHALPFLKKGRTQKRAGPELFRYQFLNLLKRKRLASLVLAVLPVLRREDDVKSQQYRMRSQPTMHENYNIIVASILQSYFFSVILRQKQQKKRPLVREAPFS